MKLILKIYKYETRMISGNTTMSAERFLRCDLTSSGHDNNPF